jgi:hypothetical protein
MCVVCDVWCVVCDVWCVVCGVRCAMCGVVWCGVCRVCRVSEPNPGAVASRAAQTNSAHRRPLRHHAPTPASKHPRTRTRTRTHTRPHLSVKRPASCSGAAAAAAAAAPGPAAAATPAAAAPAACLRAMSLAPKWNGDSWLSLCSRYTRAISSWSCEPAQSGALCGSSLDCGGVCGWGVGRGVFEGGCWRCGALGARQHL